jgi:hypothetical protein
LVGTGVVVGTSVGLGVVVTTALVGVGAGVGVGVSDGAGVGTGTMALAVVVPSAVLTVLVGADGVVDAVVSNCGSQWPMSGESCPLPKV